MRITAFFLLAVALSSAAFAEDNVVGYIKTTTGSAVVISDGKPIKAEPGTPVRIADTLKTGDKSSLGMTLKDNTLMSLGADTELTVQEYLFAPDKDELKLLARIKKGTLNYVSGVIAKLKPEAVSIQTPTGNIGVRGTHFVVSVVEEVADENNN